MSHVSVPDLGRFDFGIIRKKVLQMIGRAGFMRQDHSDLEQELLARLLQSLKSFDPQKAHRNVFVTAVVNRDVASILRDKKAAKRDHRRVCSLNVRIEVTEEGTAELADTIGDQERNAQRGQCPRSPEELAQLAMDVADLLPDWPEELRRVAEELTTKSKSQAARDLGIPRSTLYERVRRIRQLFEKAGLREYL